MIKCPAVQGLFYKQRRFFDMARIPKDVKTALRMLNEKGYSAYVVGGAVRDYIMGKPPHDWDIATSATPEQMKEVFPRTYDSGIKHGTITAQMPGGDYEITTYRSDGEYSDGRHPDAVSFVSSIEEDLARRDFTINAMAMDADGNIIDPFGGQKDIQDGVIRCVGNPNDRFHEDALRMMRAVRFKSKLGFELDEDTKNAISANAENLKNVSAERIRDEFTKMLAGCLPKKAFLDAYETGITAQVLPEFDRMMEQKQDCPWHYANVGIHTLDVVKEVDADNVKVRWAALLHDVGKPDCASKKPDGSDTFAGHPEKSAEIANGVLSRLRFSNNDRNDIVKLVSLHEDETQSDARIRALGAELGKDMANQP